jgi:SepF-like predicted cell division protein (DUF552 family)
MASIYDVYEFYLEPHDLQGRSHVVTIESAVVREIFSPIKRANEPVIVVRFVGKKKVMTLNKTQAGAIAEVCKTDNFEKWAGNKIMITPADIKVGREQKQTIAITAPETGPAPTVDQPTGK